jgi:biopolymer transport protein ExbB
MFDFFVKGGPMMYPLAFCSLVGLAIIIDRLIVLHRITGETDRFLVALRQALAKRDIARIVDLCEKDASPASRVLRAGLRKYRKGREAMEKAIEDVGKVEVDAMAKGMLLLSMISRLAPLLGFLGTITGLIKAFEALAAAAGTGNQSAIAGGVSQAMITTAAGLIIAIPIMMLVYYLNGRVNRLVGQMERNANYLLDLIDELQEEEIERVIAGGAEE